jgi:hypothetical protein
MMAAVMAAPVARVVARGAMAANDARAMHGHPPAATAVTDKDGAIVQIIGVVKRTVVRTIVVEQRTPCKNRKRGHGSYAASGCRQHAQNHRRFVSALSMRRHQV